MIDRFHVAETNRDGLDHLLKQELQRLKQTLSKEEYQQLKGPMWAFRKSPTDLADQDRQVLQHFFVH